MHVLEARERRRHIVSERVPRHQQQVRRQLLARARQLRLGEAAERVLEDARAARVGREVEQLAPRDAIRRERRRRGGDRARASGAVVAGAGRAGGAGRADWPADDRVGGRHGRDDAPLTRRRRHVAERRVGLRLHRRRGPAMRHLHPVRHPHLRHLRLLLLQQVLLQHHLLHLRGLLLRGLGGLRLRLRLEHHHLLGELRRQHLGTTVRPREDARHRRR
mmetsp:Transcript_28944/g.91697  ORF Transcript_28944/g.91697 Transcript_28944/m.91697 type:complete len:219 (+) Transcript_28944:705-1361(+)